jgi:hypothetical protein
MYILHSKHVEEHEHAERLHNVGTWLSRMVHDERFWPAVVAIVLLGTFIGLVIWAGFYGQANPESLKSYPFAPYTY